LIGEAAGVFIGSAYYPDLPGARRWLEESHEILSREVLRQSYADGCTREQALGYQMFVLQFFLVAGTVGQQIDMDFPPRTWERIEKMTEYLGVLAEGGPLPMFGDCDDGYVLDLAAGGNEVRELLSIGAVLFSRPDFKEIAGEFGEASYWLLGTDGRRYEPFLSAGTFASGRGVRVRHLLQSVHAGEAGSASFSIAPNSVLPPLPPTVTQTP
jgi:hypothetical protein